MRRNIGSKKVTYLFVAFISKVSIWPEAQDELKVTEQTAAFNKEYEVYQKSAMYGVNVISCLNKAKSNNEKYIEGGSFVDDGTGVYGRNYKFFNRRCDYNFFRDNEYQGQFIAFTFISQKACFGRR